MTDTATLEAELLYEVRDGIGRITFNRPQARNSLTFSMYQRLTEICAGAAETHLAPMGGIATVTYDTGYAGTIHDALCRKL